MNSKCNKDSSKHAVKKPMTKPDSKPTAAITVFTKTSLLNPIEIKFTSDVLYPNGIKKYDAANNCFFHETGLKAYDRVSQQLFYEGGE